MGGARIDGRTRLLVATHQMKTSLLKYKRSKYKNAGHKTLATKDVNSDTPGCNPFNTAEYSQIFVTYEVWTWPWTGSSLLFTIFKSRLHSNLEVDMNLYLGNSLMDYRRLNGTKSPLSLYRWAADRMWNATRVYY